MHQPVLASNRKQPEVSNRALTARGGTGAGTAPDPRVSISCFGSAPLIRQPTVIGKQLQQALAELEVPPGLAALETLRCRGQADVRHGYPGNHVCRLQLPDNLRAVPFRLVLQPWKMAVRHLPHDSPARNRLDDPEVDPERVSDLFRAAGCSFGPPRGNIGDLFERLFWRDLCAHSGMIILKSHEELLEMILFNERPGAMGGARSRSLVSATPRSRRQAGWLLLACCNPGQGQLHAVACPLQCPAGAGSALRMALVSASKVLSSAAIPPNRPCDALSINRVESESNMGAMPRSIDRPWSDDVNVSTWQCPSETGCACKRATPSGAAYEFFVNPSALHCSDPTPW